MSNQGKSPLLSVIIPTHGRSAKLRTLIKGIATSQADDNAFEIVVVVDGRDDTPLAVADVLPSSMHFEGLTKDHAGPAAARNFAIKHANGEWLLFFDDDARVDEHTIAGHLKHIGHNPTSNLAHLGRVDWPRELIDSPWRQLLEESSMLFFWHRMTTGQTYNYRYFWTSNLSVRRQSVVDVGGFHEGFPSAMHEDIELGWRLQQSVGMEVMVDTTMYSLHDHPLEPIDYFRREHKSGLSARAAKSINPAFHDDIWHWIDEPVVMLDALRSSLAPVARQTLNLLHNLAVPTDRRCSEQELQATYLAHMPLKRMAFLHGYLEKPFDELWNWLTGATADGRSISRGHAASNSQRPLVHAETG